MDFWLKKTKQIRERGDIKEERDVKEQKVENNEKRIAEQCPGARGREWGRESTGRWMSYR